MGKVYLNGVLTDTETGPVPNDQTLRHADKAEADAYASVPNVDIAKYSQDRNKFKLFGQSVADGLINNFFTTPAVTTMLIGKKNRTNTKERIEKENQMARDGNYGGAIKSILFGGDYNTEFEEKFVADKQIAIAKKIRNWEIALRHHTGLEAEKIQPEGFGERLVAGLGSGTASMASMFALSALGATALGPVGGVAGPYIFSYANEKAALSSQLMDAGYKAGFVDQVSDLYAYPAAALDFVSFNYLGKLLRPVAVKAITNTVGKSVTKMSFNEVGRMMTAYSKGFITEGGTEGMQQQLQSFFEVATKLKSYDFAQDMADDLVAFLVGGFIGGPAGVAGQVRSRRASISKLVNEYGMDKESAGKMYNEASLEAEILKYEELTKEVDITESVAWVEKAFTKIEGTDELNLPSEVESSTEGGFEFAEGMLEQLDAEKVDKQIAKLKEKLGDTTNRSEQSKITDRIIALETKKESINKGDDVVAHAEAVAQRAEEDLIESEPNIIPVFKNTEEAVKFGVIATPAQLQEVQKKRDNLTKRIAKLKAANKLQEAMDLAVKAQFYDEVGQAARGEPQHKEAIKEIKKNLKTRGELAAGALKTERMAEGLRQERARIKGEVSLTPSQVKQQAIKKLRQVLTAYKTGIKMSEREFKAVQKAFKTALADSALSDKVKARLLQRVLFVRTADQFNVKRAAIMENINSVVRSEKVKAIQKLALKVFKKMLDGQVSPKNQLFVMHLNRVLRGSVPTNLEMDAAETTSDMAKAVIEEAAADLQGAGDDITTAVQAFKTIQGYYTDQFQEFANFKAQERETYNKLADKVRAAVSQGVPINALQDSLDSLRQVAKQKAEQGNTVSTLSATPYVLSFMSILDMLDNRNSPGTKSMQGPLIKEFSSEPAFNKWVALTGQSKAMIDGKGHEIYGKDFAKIWMEYRGENFLDVEIMGEDGDSQAVNISRAGAMSLWLTTKMFGLRTSLLEMGIDETWLEAFEAGENVDFTSEDYAWMNNTREVLDYYAQKIAPVYERLTGQPFRRVDNYFMVQRYMVETLEDVSFSDKTSVIEAMLKGNFQKIDPTNKSYFKKRVRSKKFLVMPDVFQALSSYALDMNHFLAYADYTVKLQEAFQRSDVRKLMEKNLPAGIPPIINEFIDTLSGASVNRTADRQAMKGFFNLLGFYARNKIAPLKNIPRQFSSLGAFIQYEGIGPKELAVAAWDLQRAIKTGELKALTDTEYMKLRYSGMFDFAAKYAEDMAHAEYFSKVKLGKVRQFMVSQTLHNLVTWSARKGDRMASLVGGWAMYNKVLKETGNKNQAIKEAISAIEDTQQPIDPGRLPVAFNRADLPNRLLTIFKRTTARYLDSYLTMRRAHKVGRVNNKQFIRSMLAFHVVIPILEVMVTTGRDPWSTRGQTAVAMAAGPYAYHLIWAQMVVSMLSGLAEGLTDDDIELPSYMKDVSDSTLVGSFARDSTKLLKSLFELVQYPDFETMWDTTKAIGGVLDITPLPAKWLVQTPQSIFDMLQGDFWAAAKRATGYSDAAIERAQE